MFNWVTQPNTISPQCLHHFGGELRKLFTVLVFSLAASQCPGITRVLRADVRQSLEAGPRTALPEQPWRPGRPSPAH